MKFLRLIFGKTDKPGHAAGTAEVGPDPVMSALAELEVKRLRDALAAAAPPAETESESAAELSVARPSRVVKTRGPLPDESAAPSRSIWDLEEGETHAPPVASPAESATSPEPRRPTRSKTRVLGFEAQQADVIPLLDAAGALSSLQIARSKGYVMFPTGWLVVKDGPGKGASYTLTQGVSQIGRGAGQTVSLDFGDMAISRQNHAAIAYDGTTHQFHIGHGGKSNLVRLNGRPLLSTEPAHDGDEIQIGETTLMLKVLCTPAFNWSSLQAEGDADDMAIA